MSGKEKDWVSEKFDRGAVIGMNPNRVKVLSEGTVAYQRSLKRQEVIEEKARKFMEVQRLKKEQEQAALDREREVLCGNREVVCVRPLRKWWEFWK